MVSEGARVIAPNSMRFYLEADGSATTCMWDRYKEELETAYYDKRYVLPDGIHTEPLDYHLLATSKPGADREATINEELNIVVNAFAEAKLIGSCLPASLILARRLRQREIKTSLQDGFYMSKNIGNYAGRHVWLEDENGKTVDVGA